MDNQYLMQTMKLGTGQFKVIKWPGTETSVAMRILSMHDKTEAAAATEQYYKSIKIESRLTTESFFDTERAIQSLYKALRDPQDMSKPICDSVTTFRKSISTADLNTLYLEYCTWEKDCSPSPENLTEEEFDLLVEDIKKNPEKILLSTYSSSMLRRLIATLASQPVSLPVLNG
jgi:hypothetical protein